MAPAIIPQECHHRSKHRKEKSYQHPVDDLRIKFVGSVEPLLVPANIYVGVGYVAINSVYATFHLLDGFPCLESGLRNALLQSFVGSLAVGVHNFKPPHVLANGDFHFFYLAAQRFDFLFLRKIEPNRRVFVFIQELRPHVSNSLISFHVGIPNPFAISMSDWYVGLCRPDSNLEMAA